MAPVLEYIFLRGRNESDPNCLLLLSWLSVGDIRRFSQILLLAGWIP